MAIDVWLRHHDPVILGLNRAAAPVEVGLSARAGSRDLSAGLENTDRQSNICRYASRGDSGLSKPAIFCKGQTGPNSGSRLARERLFRVAWLASLPVDCFSVRSFRRSLPTKLRLIVLIKFDNPRGVGS